MSADDPDALSRAFARARAGEHEAFGALVREHQRRVYSLALRLLRSRAAAEDLTQEIFLLLLSHIGELTSPAHLRYWLRRVTTHRAIDELRRRPPVAEPAALEGLPAPVANEDPLLARRLRTLVGELPAHPRAVMVLRFQEDLDPSEIAELLDLPVNTVKSHLRRALALLRGRLA